MRTLAPLIRRLAFAFALALAPPAAADLFAARADGTPVRREASPRATVLFHADRHYPFTVEGREGDFARVRDFEGEVGYVAAAALERRATCILTRRAEVRSGPSLHHRALFRAERGAAFRVLERAGEWLKVEHARGRAGFVRLADTWGADRPEPKRER